MYLVCVLIVSPFLCLELSEFCVCHLNLPERELSVSIRHSLSLISYQQSQIRGGITFEAACADLHYRCEAIRADELLATPVRDNVSKRALVTTKAKRINKKGCAELIKIYLPLCPLHYHQCVSGKTPTVDLKDSLGFAAYNENTKSADYPSTIPTNRLPVPKADREKKAVPKRRGLLQKSHLMMRSNDGVWLASRVRHLPPFMSILAQASV